MSLYKQRPLTNFQTFSKNCEIVAALNKKKSNVCMWKSDFGMTHEEINYICCDLTSFFEVFFTKNCWKNALASKNLSNDSKNWKNQLFNSYKNTISEWVVVDRDEEISMTIGPFRNPIFPLKMTTSTFFSEIVVILCICSACNNIYFLLSLR